MRVRNQIPIPDDEEQTTAIVCDVPIRIHPVIIGHRKNGRRATWTLVRSWWDGMHMWATIRRRFEH